MTLVQLGRAAGLSHAFLSQVERGLANPGIDSVARIAAGLGVSEASLWRGETKSGEISIERGKPAAGRGDEATGPEATGPESPAGVPEVVIHALQGVVEVGAAGRLSRLEEGASISLPGDTAHTLRLVGPGPSRMIYVSANLGRSVVDSV
jgi:hypothetical protein